MKYTKHNHTHTYFKNEDGSMECYSCGLLQSTIESSPKKELTSEEKKIAKEEWVKRYVAHQFGIPLKKESKSFFDYSDKEKEEIITKAAVESSKAQQELIDTPKEEICECHKPGFSCTGCELGTECESMVHFERIKPLKECECHCHLGRPDAFDCLSCCQPKPSKKCGCGYDKERHNKYCSLRCITDDLHAVASKSKESPVDRPQTLQGHKSQANSAGESKESMLHKSVEDKTWEEIIDNLPRDKAEIIYFSRHGIKKFISDLLGKTYKKGLLKQREGDIREFENLPVFANKYEREYQIGINEVWKQLKGLKKGNDE